MHQRLSINSYKINNMNPIKVPCSFYAAHYTVYSRSAC